MNKNTLKRIEKQPATATPEEILEMVRELLALEEKKEKRRVYYREYNKRESRKEYMRKYMKEYKKSRKK